jgi:DNA-binding transcriptional LysR family regulator
MQDATSLDIKQLRLLDLLASTASVTRTAEQLGQTQSTVSIMLARLRKQLSDPLVVRTSAGMQSTPRLDAMMPTIRSVLEGMRSLSALDSRFDPRIAERVFRIFMPDASHITLLPRLFSHVHALAPRVRLEAATIDAGLEVAMQSGEGDLAMGSELGLEAGFYQQTLFGQDWVCLVNSRHPRLGKQSGQKLTLKNYLDEDHIRIVAGSGSRVLEPEAKRQKLERRVLMELPGFLGLPAILTSSDMVATLPRQIGEALAASAQLRVLPCPFQLPSLTVKQHWHSRYHHDPANRWLRSIVAELFMSPTHKNLDTD